MVVSCGLIRNSRTGRKRDRLIVSKGHAAAIVYAALAEAGFFPVTELDRYSADGGPLSGHVTKIAPGVELSTGSLGHGLPVAAVHGAGCPARRRKMAQHLNLQLCEMDEDSNWEAIQFAQHFRLSNLVAIIDYNKISELARRGRSERLHPLAEKFLAFNWGVHQLDGHDHEALTAALASAPTLAGRPTAIVAHTIKGKGVSFMEGQLAWHYKNVDAAQLRVALTEIETAP